MTNSIPNREIIRWILAAAGAAVAFFGVFLCSTILLFTNILPPDLTVLVIGLSLGPSTVLVGSLLAPRQKVKTALFLWALCTAVGGSVFGSRDVVFLLSLVAGGGAAVAFMTWWVKPTRSPSTTKRVLIGAGTAGVAIFGLLYARFIDFPARPEPLTPQVTATFGSNGAGVEAFYHYDLGGFLDSQDLWRIEADELAIEQIISNLNLSSTPTVSQRFWDMPPHYWPESMPAGGEAFQSAEFVADGRGQDGQHYFLLYDKAQNKAYVWVKNNF